MSTRKARCNRSKNWKCNSSRKGSESSKIYTTPKINWAGQNRWAPCRWYHSQNWERAKTTSQNLRKLESSIQSQIAWETKLLLMRCQTQVKEISFRIKCYQSYKWASSQTQQHFRKSTSQCAQLSRTKLTGAKSWQLLKASATNSCRATFQPPTQALLILKHSDLETQPRKQQQ